MKQLLLLLAITGCLAAHSQINEKCAYSRFLVATPVQISGRGEFTFGLELGVIPANTSVYITFNGVVYTAKKDMMRQWTTAEGGVRLYYFNRLTDRSSVHVFTQLRFVTQGNENNFEPVQDMDAGRGYYQWSPGTGACWMINMSRSSKGDAYIRFELEKTFGAPVNRLRVGVAFVGLL